MRWKNEKAAYFNNVIIYTQLSRLLFIYQVTPIKVLITYRADFNLHLQRAPLISRRWK